MTPDQQIEQIELSIAQAKDSITKLDAFTRLKNNKDFILLIEEGYFEKEASRVVLLKADPEMQDAQSQTALDHSIIAIGQFRQYLRTIVQMGHISQKALHEHEETIEEILEEGV